MLSKIKCSVLFTLFLLTGNLKQSFAQEKLTLNSAIEATLKNNFFISIAKNDEQISKNNNTLGNAGFLPSLNLDAGISIAKNNTEQQYSNGNSIEQNGVKTDNLNAALTLNWTLFDGTKMFATKSKLELEQTSASLLLKIEIENKVAEVIAVYFNIVRQQQLIKVIEETIKIYDERVKIAETRFAVGSASKLDLLQAQVNRNARLSELMNQQFLLDTYISVLNRLMGKNEFTFVVASDSITTNYNPVLDDLQKSAQQNNLKLNLDTKSSEISNKNINEIRAQRYPWLYADLRYNFNKTENEVGFSLLNQNSGLNAGLTLSWNLFDGFNTNNRIKNAKINYQTSQLILADTRSKIKTELYIAFKKFESEKAILKLEESNLTFAQENVIVSLEAYRLGSISGLQLTEAQNSLEESYSRLIDARYLVKLSETALMKLNGDLIK